MSNYAHIVHDLTPGVYYFRLRQLDRDGGFKYSPIRSVVISGKVQVVVHPNPTNEIAFFQVSLDKESFIKMQLLDALGRVVGIVANDRFSAGNFDFAYNIQQLPKGIYYYHLTGNNIDETGKFLVTE